jgi:two-component system sensor histidine kinase KdpD
MARGILRVYLGSAPGVGKTHAMLDEGRRRRARGARVVVATLTDASRPGLADLAAGFDRLSGDRVDIDAIVAAGAQVALVDDLAGGDDHAVRWEQVRTLVELGIDVVTTLDICEIESLAETVAAITGTPPARRVPDEFLRTADQVELVDMSPEAVRRRLAHGHIVPSDAFTPALVNRFRPVVLGRLRQLALVWMVERVAAESAGDADADAAEPAARRERVVVALGGEGGDALVRRAARLAGRTGGDLLGVHVVVAQHPPGPDLERQRRLLSGLGGTYREVVGDDVTAALVAFARVEQATQVVLGTRPGADRNPSVLPGVLAAVGTFDVHVVATGVSGDTPTTQIGGGAPARMQPPHRRIAWLLCLVGLPLLTLLATAVRDHVSVGSVLLADLCLVMAVAALGGLRPGLTASVAAFGLTNWFITPPLHTLTVGQAENVVALSVFVIVTVVVSVLVDRGARRSREAASARAEAAALARSAATLVGAHDPLPELLEQVRATFSLRSAAVFERGPSGWWPTQQSGAALLDVDGGTAIDLSADGGLRLVVDGDAVRPEQLDVLRAFADQLAMAVEARQLRIDAADADLVAQGDALRSALLRAVSHDFRTPLATITAAASGLQQADASFTDDDRTQLLAEIVTAADRLERMVRDLLDMSRLEAGAIDLALVPVALEEVVAAALASAAPPPGRVAVDVSESTPLVVGDRALLERAVANVVSNALAWSPADRPVRIEAVQANESVDLRVVDRGPGVASADRERMFTPFQRLGDRSRDAGVGLGLAIAHGFVEAMGGSIAPEETPGGGLTMSIVLPVAEDGR